MNNIIIAVLLLIIITGVLLFIFKKTLFCTCNIPTTTPCPACPICPTNYYEKDYILIPTKNDGISAYLELRQSLWSSNSEHVLQVRSSGLMIIHFGIKTEGSYPESILVDNLTDAKFIGLNTDGQLFITDSKNNIIKTIGDKQIISSNTYGYLNNQGVFSLGTFPN